MYKFSDSGLPSTTHLAPRYLPLDDSSKQLAMSLLMRKGSLMVPPLTRDEAFQIAQTMRLEQFAADEVISFEAQSAEHGRLMLVLAGEVNIRLRDTGQSRSQYSPVDQNARWATATEGATLGLVHAFAGLSSKFIAQATTELFVASLSRQTLQAIKKSHPQIGLRVMEMLAMELAMVALDHERNLQAMNNVARSMQNLIDGETAMTRPAPLF